MESKKNLPEIVPVKDDDEALFLAALNTKAELKRTQLALARSEKRREEEKREARREINGMTAFVGVFACLLTVVACLLAAPWWTAVAPMVLLLAVMRKAGWL